VSRTVRDAAFDVLRERGLTTLFANPGSTEVSLLAGLPDDLRFVLALHEGSVIGMASGYAIGRREPAMAILHTTAGLGNGVAALATARVNRAPLVVLVGQQDRRHLVQEPFLAGRLRGLAGEYPVSYEEPVRPQDVPGALARAYHEARARRGPALVIVPMDDWLAPAPEPHEITAPAQVIDAHAAHPDALDALADLLAAAKRPALVVGAGADDADGWAGLTQLAERLDTPVFQEAFGARAGFPQDHPLFVGHLSPSRQRVRKTLAPYDVVLVVGAPVLRQYAYEPGALFAEGTRVAVVTDDPAEAHRAVAELAVVASPGAVCAALAERVAGREDDFPRPRRSPQPVVPPGPGEPLRASHLLAALAERLPRDAVLIEEAPSARPELHSRVPAREPLGFLSAAMGGLGFALPAAIGLRMASPRRPVVTVVGDGASLYQIQALWSAAHYGAGALFIVLANGRYAIMDRLAEATGKAGPWPAFEAVDVAAIARGFGCPAQTISDHDTLLSTLDEVLPGLAERTEPLLLEVVIAPDTTFEP
jgi:thiamine pyrophosphate-dependent acetolactate synthase large subunit-like protein